MLNKTNNQRSEMDLFGNHHNSKYTTEEAKRIETQTLSPKTYRSNISSFNAYTNPYHGKTLEKSKSVIDTQSKTPYFHNNK